MILSHNTKESIKTALAMTLAYGISLGLNWDRPYWAGFAIAFISLNTIGQSLNKAALRMAGTVMAAIVALTLIALFSQQRWLFILFLSIWFGGCTYMMMGKKYSYFWHVSAFVSLILCADGGFYPEQAFLTAMLRLQQTGLGILVYSVVAVLLWPNNSRKACEACALELLKTQQKLFKISVTRGPSGQDKAAAQSLHTQEIAQIKKFGLLLDAAETDSEEIRQAKQPWRSYQLAAGELAHTIQRWWENHDELETRPLQEVLPGLETFSQELDRRLTAIQQLLRGDPARAECTVTAPGVNANRMQDLSHFHRAAVWVAHRQLRDIDRLTQTMLEAMSRIRGMAPQPEDAQPKPKLASRQPFVPDLDRLHASLRVMTIIWLAFLAVFYISDIPGGVGFVTISGTFGLIFATNPQLPISIVIRPVTVSILFASSLYFFLMPRLSSFSALGTMIFAVTFCICYFNAKPQQVLNRALGLAFFIMVIAVSNQQSYSFLSVANTALIFYLMLFLMTITAYIPFSPRPERVIVRLLKRYFRSAECVLSTVSRPDDSHRASWRLAFHRYELATLPDKLNTWVAHANAGCLGTSSVQQLPAMTGSLQGLTYRLQDVMDFRGRVHTTQGAAAMRKDMHQWLKQFSETLQELAADPSAGRRLARGRLKDLLTRAEDRMAGIMKPDVSRNVSNRDLENVYCLLAACRSSSQAVVEYVTATDPIDWTRWHQERF
ncbi:MAG: FUSC family protein [Anaerohalosphaeraceae bacterium]|jgi:uncharacterized membrane protein YccC